jgi:hypothetical protein
MDEKLGGTAESCASRPTTITSTGDRGRILHRHLRKECSAFLDLKFCQKDEGKVRRRSSYCTHSSMSEVEGVLVTYR